MGLIKWLKGLFYNKDEKTLSEEIDIVSVEKSDNIGYIEYNQFLDAVETLRNHAETNPEDVNLSVLNQYESFLLDSDEYINAGLSPVLVYNIDMGEIIFVSSLECVNGKFN